MKEYFCNLNNHEDNLNNDEDLEGENDSPNCSISVTKRGGLLPVSQHY